MLDRTWLSILVMAAVTITIRITPVTLMRKPVESRFIRSFLTYVPYATLAVMTFPAILDSAGTPVVAAVCSIVAFLLALL